jgi:2-polyprenyl-3-methyl-5-hydroxy-6-metoxy-1,4-benzoquinol methylase
LLILQTNAKLSLTCNTRPPNNVHICHGVLHDKLVVSRRAGVLSDWFAKLMPPKARVLDVGCGDGAISVLLLIEEAVCRNSWHRY